MNANEVLITQFYTAFSQQNANGMIACYHPEIEFEDPAFGKLKGDDVRAMWKMLLANNKTGIDIRFYNVKSDDTTGCANWVATYIFTKTKRKVINRIAAKFEFKEGLIIKHKDNFDLWSWSKQALEWKGYLLGWTAFLKKSINKQALASLNRYQNK
ncbi:nuclear transport factor 2 family protein [Flavobacterium kingsejongi]|uniref:Limonene-1,2-epoxide hydrolase n=1 Tax=Flavobacterium kingsejongi TaxID=1678728 RepID=A0A2S1LPQ1_9FLAO|nr:nuclear transport factor 2 family protein [Flavobacterium kingsejongi]AWG25730.1 limonene-1,2-epoxide hydrolase [Flavobacterium kingsejongi]